MQGVAPTRDLLRGDLNRVKHPERVAGRRLRQRAVPASVEQRRRWDRHGRRDDTRDRAEEDRSSRDLRAWRPSRPRAGEPGRQAIDDELEEPLRTVDVLEAGTGRVAKETPARSSSISSRVAFESRIWPPWPRRRSARRDGAETDVALAAPRARRCAGPSGRGPRPRPARRGRQRALRDDRRLEGSVRPRKATKKRHPGVDLAPLVRRGRLAQDRVVASSLP